MKKKGKAKKKVNNDLKTKKKKKDDDLDDELKELEEEGLNDVSDDLNVEKEKLKKK